MLWLLGGCVALYVLVVALIWFAQERLLYLAPSHTAADVARLAAVTHTVVWPSADDFRGALAEPARAAGTVVVFHGNAGSAFDRVYYASMLNPRGYRVLLAEYPGYGTRPGRTRERVLAADAAETLRRVRAQFGAPVYVIGESLGAAVAASALRHDPGLAEALLLVTPWDALASVSADALPWLPARWLTRDAYDTASNLEAYRGAVGILRALDDEVIRPVHTDRLLRALPHAQVWSARGGHNGWPDGLPGDFWDEVALRLLRGAERITPSRS